MAMSVLFSGVLVAGSAQAAPVGVAAQSGQAQAGQAQSGHDQSDQNRSRVVTYVALGDSYAAGQGALPYENACLQNASSYPEVLDDLKHVRLVADPSCSGATTADVLSVQIPSIRKTRKVDVVTGTIGANDLNGPAVAAACSVSFESPECQAGLAGVYALLTPPAPELPSELAVRLTTTLTAVASTIPGAAILVTGYPFLFETPPQTHPNYATIVQLNAAIAALNDTIEGVAVQLAQSGIDIRYVDVTAAFAGHGIGSADPWINSTGIEAFHPTAAGYRAYATAVRAVW
ncbi:MAG: hydrolase family protein [Cryobacterium sp.]|nr:hydrolase family protein [Cryobacterium sp.]